MERDYAVETDQPQADPVLVLESERQRLMHEAFRLRDEADAINFAMPVDLRCRTIQIGTVRGAYTDEQPVYAYCEEDIRDQFACHRSERTLVWGEQHSCVTTLGAKEEALIAEFRAMVEKVNAAEEANGYAELDHQANALAHQSFEIEDRLMATTALTASGLIVQLTILSEIVKYNEKPDEWVAAVTATLTAGILAHGSGGGHESPTPASPSPAVARSPRHFSAASNSDQRAAAAGRLVAVSASDVLRQGPTGTRV